MAAAYVPHNTKFYSDKLHIFVYSETDDGEVVECFTGDKLEPERIIASARAAAPRLPAPTGGACPAR